MSDDDLQLMIDALDVALDATDSEDPIFDPLMDLSKRLNDQILKEYKNRWLDK